MITPDRWPIIAGNKVHSLVLSEPPAHQLIRGTIDGEAAYQDFMTTVMIPAANYFTQHDVQRAMEIFVNGMAAGNRFHSLSSEARGDAMRNSRSIDALFVLQPVSIAFQGRARSIACSCAGRDG